MERTIPPPRKVVNYRIADEDKAGALFILGDAAAPKMAILCAGFPDDHAIFLPFASLLAENTEGGCLVGVACLPGYDDREDWPWTAHKAEGYTFNEMAMALREAVRALRAESTYEGADGGGAKLTAIFHDWGVVPGLMYANRALAEPNADLSPREIVLFDVLPPPHPEHKDVPAAPKESLYHVAVTLGYRIVLAAAFLIQRFVSKLLALAVLGLAFGALGALRLTPLRGIDVKVINARNVPLDPNRMIFMAYPYFYMFRALLTGNQDFSGCSLPKRLDVTPVLYLYGTEKRVMFHDNGARMVLQREGEEGRKSNAVAVKDAGHYLYVQQPEICFEAVKAFMS